MKRLIFTELDHVSYAFYYEKDTLVELDLDQGIKLSEIGQVFVGQVKNILPNIQAAFVEYTKGKNGFLPLSDISWRGQKLHNSEELLIQIAKDGVKTKDPVVTTKLSMTGLYTVVQLYDNRIGYSGKLSKNRKEQLKSMLQPAFFSLQQDFQKKNNCAIGIVVRTSAEDASVTKEKIEKEALCLAEKLAELKKRGESRKVFSRLTKEETFALRKYRHFRQLGIDEIITDKPEIYEQLKSALEDDRLDSQILRLYCDESFPLCALYSLTPRLSEAFERKVWLGSGGFLVIDETEALTVIDVNSGKNITGKEKEQTFQKINNEAAVECARQIRLRNFNGIIIIDFINCKDNTGFISLLKEEIKKDPIKTSYVDITPLGLVELTRQKMTPPISEKINRRN